MADNVVISKLRCSLDEKRHFCAYTASLVSAALLLVLMAVYFLWHSHQQAVAQAGFTTKSLTNLLESRIEHDLERLTASLHKVVDEGRPYLQGEAAPELALSRMGALFQGFEKDFAAVQQGSIVAASGQLLYAYKPGGVVAQTPDFAQPLCTATGDGYYFSDGYIATSPDQWFMDHGVPICTADGRLQAVIVATINLTQYADVLRSIEVGEGGLSLVRRSDNFKLILRHPLGNERDFNSVLPLANPIRQLLGTGAVAGTLAYTASTDGAERLASFRRLDHYPFYVQVSLGEDSYLAGWRHQTLIASLILLAFLVLVVISIRRARRYMLERIALTRAITESELRFRSLFENSLDAVVVLDAGGISACNQAALEMFGVADEATFKGLSHQVFFAPWQADGKRSADKHNDMRKLVTVHGKQRFEWLFRRYDTGAEFTAEVMLSAIELDGQEKYLAHLRDFTERKQYEDTINQLAFYDPLTQLPNRRLLLDRLTQAGAQCRRSQKYGALIFIDLDNFKTLNDHYGHAAGDLLLQKVAERLLGCVRTEDTVARLGGDEFVALLTSLDEQPELAHERACRVADKILGVLSRPYELNLTEHPGSPPAIHLCSASLGVSLFQGEESAADIMQRADRAMYRAKADGRGIVRYG